MSNLSLLPPLFFLREFFRIVSKSQKSKIIAFWTLLIAILLHQQVHQNTYLLQSSCPAVTVANQ
jgi:hypothetical protein